MELLNRKAYESPVADIEMFTIREVLTGVSDDSQDTGGTEIEPTLPGSGARAYNSWDDEF